MSDKVSIIAAFILITIVPNVAIAEVDDELIVNKCNDEWGDDFEMVAYCREQQRAAGKTWVSILDAAEPGSATETIIQNCVSEWSADYEMLVYCHEQQDKALKSLAVAPDGVPDDVFDTISSKCESEWGDDFEMIKYCQDQQVTAWKSLQ